MENSNSPDEKFIKALRWPLEFIAVIAGGILFLVFMYAISGTMIDDFGHIFLGISYLILYLAGIIWLAASRIVCAIKKR